MPDLQVRSLSTRFLLAVALVAMLGVGTVAWVANRVTSSQFTLYVSQGGRMRAQTWAQWAAGYYAEHGSWVGVESILSIGQGRGQGMGRMISKESSADHERILIVGTDGQVVFDTEEELVGHPVDLDVQEVGAPIVVDGQTMGTLVVTTVDLSGQSEYEHRFLDAVRQAVLWAVLLVAAASLVVAFLLSRQLIAPLRQLTAAAEGMARGDLLQRVEVRSRDEIGELGQAFNKMAGDLHAAEVQRRQMTADIAHELRNPLSVIRGNLEAMRDGIYTVDVEHLDPIYEETILLQRLVEDLRLLSLADAGQLFLIWTDVDVAGLLFAVAEGAQAAARAKQVSLSVDAPDESLVVEGDADRLRQVLRNLVSNALCYTPAGGQIVLAAQMLGPEVQISVSDSGTGIAPRDLPHVFDRFYRADTARDRASGGSGLGLAIARALVEAHGGTMDVESVLGQGSTFTLVLPIEQINTSLLK